MLIEECTEKMAIEPVMGEKEKNELALKLLSRDELGWFLSNYRSDIPELLHVCSKLLDTDWAKEDFLVLCGRLVRYSDHVVQHVEPLVLQLDPPWVWDEPKQKRPREDLDRQISLFSALLWLLHKVDRLESAWDWSGVFTFLSHPSSDVSIICLEIIRHLLPISPPKLNLLRNHICNEEKWMEILFKLYGTDYWDILKLAKDPDHFSIPERLQSSHVVNLEHVSLPKVGLSSSFLVPVNSTKNALVCMGEAVSVRKAVLLRGNVGVGKTSLIQDLGRLTGRTDREILTLQISDSTDARLLLGLYRCTDIPGKFVWEPGLLTRAVQLGHWLTIEDVDRAQQDVLALITSLVQTGKLTVPNLGGSLEPKSGFQLFLTERGGGVSSDISKIARIIPVPEMSKEELREVIVRRFPSLHPIIEKIIRLFEIVGEDSTGLNLKHIRQISLRDLVRWCGRTSSSFKKGDDKSQHESLYLDAVDCFSKFIPDRKTRELLSEELAYTLNITKEESAYLSSKYKPQVTLTHTYLQVGRVSLTREMEKPVLPPIYSLTRHSAVLLESVARAVEEEEPVLLVGETGVGKTASVQFLADQTGRRLRVINMNQQSDSTDLLGGYKPVDISHAMHNILQMFNKVFDLTFVSTDNTKFRGHLSTCYLNKRWADAVALMSHSLKAAVSKLKQSSKLTEDWGKVSKELKTVSEILKQSEKTTIFSFIEGLLTKAVKEGYWILLDEVNMATPETLECLSSLLDRGGSVCLYEKGDYLAVPRHSDFRLFACMNPATDTGKHDLPPGLRNRFTELYVDEISDVADIKMLVTDYLQNLSLPGRMISNIVTFFQTAKVAAKTKLTTGTGERPTFSLRTLCRALRVANRNPCGNVIRSLYEGFSLSFLTELDGSSHRQLKELLEKYILSGKDAAKLVKQSIQSPSGSFANVEGFWVARGKEEPKENEKYILTKQVSNNLKDLARVVSLCDHPVLIQGDTSVGKTSLVSYLAQVTGNKCVRVNNHEHTDIQEYVGSYTSDETGKLVFKLGVLAEAMLQGSWIILDELNLAPTDVLEALNRVLDDNRQLYIPETQQTISAAPGFRLFGTQNPPGLYGGRKVLSKAFKNRFVELHFNQLPADELETILENRCGLPKTYAKKMISVLGELQKHRRGSAAFAGKEGFITLRDLFRWAERYRLAGNTDPGSFYDWEQHIAEEGFMLLGARIRNSAESQVVIEILEKVFKKKVIPSNLFSLHENTSSATRPLLETLLNSDIPGLAWTFDMRRMAVLVAQAWKFEEPVLLVGETGCGKTTAVQVLARIQALGLSSLNCHRHTESSDFLGGLRPDRNTGEQKKGLNFSWCDGPLVTAMRRGQIFLADEISLADDSVIERLNSVLEPERRVLLAEKIDSDETEVVSAHPNFRFVGTMNPGGDFGKKELSPALKNRFTEIWCPSIESAEQILSITRKNLCAEGLKEKVEEKIVEFVEWIRRFPGISVVVSIRDILAWINFINKVRLNCLFIPEAFIQGAHLVWLDGLQLDGVANPAAIKSFQTQCAEKLSKLSNCTKIETKSTWKETSTCISVPPFSLDKRAEESDCQYIFSTCTTTQNVQKILRALQINKPILLEGSPGIGKTSLVEALARKIGQPVVRINLSDQTDVCDLFGSDLPVEGGAVGQFAWRNGPFLDALQSGDWILLDELNLASQSVLEGLNAVFDHRGEVYIPELDRTFPLNERTRIFGCQNPLSEGGDRKGLPKSFLNRFSKVYMSGLTSDDYRIICQTLHPELEIDLIDRLVRFNEVLEDEVVKKRLWGQLGAPWEFNLRDLLRWCQAMKSEGSPNPGKYVGILYAARFRRNEDKERLFSIYKTVFHPTYQLMPVTGALQVNELSVRIGQFSVERGSIKVGRQPALYPLRQQMKILEAMAGCVNNAWPVILTGVSDSGKSSLVNYLSSLCTRSLEIISLNSSSDTMDLLGGFEQADVGRSILQVFATIKEKVKVSLDASMEHDAVSALKFMEDIVKLNGMFNSATQMKKRKRQLEILFEMLESIQKRTGSLNLELKREISSLKTVSKHGTFEWIESLLCRALREGSWLLIDNVNLCSASVLDRLNALFERGGKLTINERGILDGEMPVVEPHPDFRVFMLYDPSRGDISRAMRNRGVEVYVPASQETELLPSERMGLISTALQSAVSSDSALTSCLQLSCRSGLKQLTEAASVTSLQTLCGVQPECQSVQTAILPLSHRLCLSLCSGSTSHLFPDLSKVCYELIPVLEQTDDEELLYVAFRFFMNYVNLSSKDLRLRIVTLILRSPALTDICHKFTGNKLFKSLYENISRERIWQERILPSGDSDFLHIANRLSLILVTLSKFKTLQEKANQNPKCLLSCSNVNFQISSPVLQQFQSKIMELLKVTQNGLTVPGELSDDDWNNFDSFLFWFYELCDLGLQSVSGSQEEDLERLLSVFWFWLIKKIEIISKFFSPSCQSAFSHFHQVIEAMNYESKSFSKFRAVTDVCPVPPQSEERLITLESLNSIQQLIKNTNPLTRFLLHANSCHELESVLTEFAGEKLSFQDTVTSSLKILEKYASAQNCSNQMFHQLQLTLLQSRLAEFSISRNGQHSCYPVDIKLCTMDNPTDMEARARINLYYCRNPTLELFRLEHDPVDCKLSMKEKETDIVNNALTIVSHVINSETGIPIVTYNDKCHQINELSKILKSFVTPDRMRDLTEMFEKDFNMIVQGLLLAENQDNDVVDVKILLAQQNLDDQVNRILTDIVALPNVSSLFHAHVRLCYLGLLKLHIFGCLGTIDPAEKQALKYRQNIKELRYVKNQLYVIDKFRDLVGTLHPHKEKLSERKTFLEDYTSKIKCKSTLRGQQSFSVLSNTVKHFKDSLGSVNTVINMLTNLSRTHEDLHIESVLSETQVWIRSSTKFCSDLLDDHCNFPDLVLPIVEAVTGLILSVDCAVSEIESKLVRRRCENMDSILLHMATPNIPAELDITSYIKFCLDPAVSAFMQGNHDLKLLKSSLVLCEHVKTFAPNLVIPRELFTEVLNKLLTLWRMELELKRQKEIEDEAVYKTRNLCSDEDEDKNAEDEFTRLFPSYREVFADITPVDNLNESMAVDDDEARPAAFSTLRLEKIKDIASFVLQFLTSCNKDGLKKIYRENFTERMNDINSLVTKQRGMCSQTVEVKIIPALISLCNYAADFSGTSDKGDYNFYHDANVEETKLLHPLLEAVGSAVDKLLNEFPENPVLLQIVMVKNRILQFSMRTPLSKSLTGLELLLGACQEWEKNAHRGISLQPVMDTVSNLILRWRKLELSNWKSLLKQTLTTIRAESTKYWLHVMGAMMEAKSKLETVHALVQFIEASTLADFHVRLEILKSVSVIMQMLDSRKKWVTAAVVNIREYYFRFSHSVETRLETVFKASEKEIGQLIKMARWKDTNFWSVKNIVDKTRKVIHKTMREYRKSVTEFSKQYFIDEGSVDEAANKHSLEAFTLTPILPKEPRIFESIRNMSNEVIGTYPSLAARAHQISIKVGKTVIALDLSSEISDLTPKILSEMEKLQKLNVNSSKSKEEQKKQAGFIQQMKRRALNDLFKSLQNLGLSYRHGLVNCADMSNKEEFLQLLEHKVDACQDWDKYFLRCWARFRQLVPLLDKQLPDDVSPMLAERFQGFSQHSLDSLTNWRRMIVRFSNLLHRLETMLSEIQTVENSTKVISAVVFRSTLENTMVTLSTVVLVLENFSQDFPEVEQSSESFRLAKSVLEEVSALHGSAPRYLAGDTHLRKYESAMADLKKTSDKIRSCAAAVAGHPVSERLYAILGKTQRLLDFDPFMEVNSEVKKDSPLREVCETSIFRTLLGMQGMLKNLKLLKDDDGWLSNFSAVVENFSKYKCVNLVQSLEKSFTVLELVPEVRCLTLTMLIDVVGILEPYRASFRTILNHSMLAFREFSKLLSVLLNVFKQIAVQGFCPVQGLEDDEKQSGEMDFKSSEEETGLGGGEGSKDVSDQIDNEDMLDGAYDGKEKEEEQKETQEEENGIEMSDNFDSELQDKKETEGENEDDEDKNENELEDEIGEIEGNEDLDKEMWGDQQEEEEDENDLGESKEQGNTEEDVSENLSSNEKQDTKQEGEKRQRKEEEEVEPEFDDNQVDEIHGEDNKFPEPEQIDLPNEMDMEVDEQEDPFEEHEGDNEPEAQPDFEDEMDKNDDNVDNEVDDDDDDNDDEDADDTKVEKFDQDENPEDETIEASEENEKVKLDNDTEKGPEDTIANEENKEGKDSVQNETEFDQSNKDESSGMNNDAENKEDSNSFSVASKKESKEESKDKSGTGTESEENKLLADESMKGERLELLEGNMTGEEGQKSADTYQHVMDQREEDKAAIDKADENVRDQVFMNDFEMDTEENTQDKTEKIQEKKTDTKSEGAEKSVESEEKGDQEKQKQDTEKEFIETQNISRGTESLLVRQEFDMVPATSIANSRFDTDLSLQQITLSDSEENTAPVLTELAHQLSEQLRLILNPTKASNLQGDFRTGKRLNMRKIIPFIASDFKKDKIWLRRTKPNKREFQILVALDDSASMSDNKSRQIALESLNTISSALALLEAGQIGVLRFGSSAEVIHPLNVQWSQTAGHKIQNQFRFDQKSTSVISLLSLATALFQKHRGSSSSAASLSQLLVIISDGRGIFHEGKEKVLQSVVNSRCAGFFCLYLIVENPENKDSVLDVRQPVFNNRGELEGIHSYMDSFPFQHYIILRDVENLPATLSDALRQWFQLVCAS